MPENKGSNEGVIVVAIDPGTSGGGYAIISYPEDVNDEPEVIQCGELVAPKECDLFGKVAHLVDAIHDMANEQSLNSIDLKCPGKKKPQKVVIVCERYFAALRRMSGAMAIPYLIGHLGASLNSGTYGFELVNMMSWKKFLGIKGNATKTEVRAAVVEKYDIPSNLKQHVYDAIGIGYFYKSIRQKGDTDEESRSKGDQGDMRKDEGVDTGDIGKA